MLFAFGIVNFECSALFGHLNRGIVGRQCQRFLNFFCKVGRFFRSVSQVQSRQHIALGRDSDPRTSPGQRLSLNFLPQFTLGTLDILSFRVGGNLFQNLFNLFRFQIDNVVHDALCQPNMFFKQVEVEIGILTERVHDIRIQVDRQQSAAVVRAKRYLAARIG